MRPPRAKDAQLRPFGAPADMGSGRQGRTPPAHAEARVPPKVFEWDVAAQKLTIRSSSGIFPRRGGVSNVTEIYDNDPTSAKLEYRINWGFKIADLDVDTHTVVRMSPT